MKKIIRKFLIVWALIIPAIIYGQEAPSQLLEPSQIKADIDTLIATLMDVHPTFQTHYKANNLQYRIDSIKKQITKPMSALDFFRIMQPIISIDGHTTLLYNGPLYDVEESPLFPFKVIIYNNELYIKENLSENKSLVKGSLIEKINGISSQTIIHKLYSYVPGVKEAYKSKRLEESFHVFMALVYGSFSDFNISVNNSEIKLMGAKWDAFQELPKPKFELRFYDDDIAYIYKRLFMPPKDFMHFMDSAFALMSEKKINYLIIDNLIGGGFTDLADSLMSYYTDKPINMMEMKKTKVSVLTKEFIEDKKTKGTIQDGYFIEEYAKHSSDRKNRFSGKTYILSGPRSYSTGTCFSAAAKCCQNAFIVGEESGQPLLSNGDQNQFVLPETNMSCVTALSIVYMPCNNNDQNRGVLPDYPYAPSLDDILNDREYTLEYTLKLLREEKSRKY